MHKLFLLRHGHPDYSLSSSRNDPELSQKGIFMLDMLGKKNRERLANVTYLATSSMKRAYQTSKTIQYYLSPKATFDTVDALLPDSNLDQLVFWLEETMPNETVLIVGHHPELYALTEYLVSDTNSIPIINRGTLIEFEIDQIPIRKCARISHFTS